MFTFLLLLAFGINKGVTIAEVFFCFFGCLVLSLQHTGLSSSYSKWGLLFIAVRGFLMALASVVKEHSPYL